MIKDIVVNLGLGRPDPAGDFAISMAEAFEAHVLGVAFSYEPIIPGTVMGGIPPEFIESRSAPNSIRRRAPRSPASSRPPSAPAFRSKRASQSPAFPAPPIDRAASAGASIWSLSASPNARNRVPDEVVDEGVLFESGRPVIFVPFIQKGGTESSTASWCAGTAAAPPPAPLPTRCRS